MKYEKARKYLEYIQDAEEVIQNKMIEKFQLNCLMTSVTAPTDREAVKTSGVSDKIGNLIPKLDEIERQIESLIESFVEAKLERIAVIETLGTGLEYKVLHRRYIQYQKLVDIASSLGYSYDYIREIHEKALEKVEDFINSPH